MSVAFSIVIPTFERPGDLAITLDALAAQTHAPTEIIIVDSSTDSRTRELCEEKSARLPIRWLHSDARSAALQRNTGADLTTAPVIAFMDDDITLRPDAAALICEVFARDPAAGGIAARVEEIQRPPPSRLTLLYYRLQAGYAHPTYGARLFGPAINCLPCYTEPAERDLIPAEWLNSGCVFYRREPFMREKFPAFDGYSFMEDVHLSARIAKTHRLFFHITATCSHRDGTNSLKRDHLGLARQRIRNQRIVAREVMGQRGPSLAWKFFLHRLFASLTILRAREPGWTQSLRGTWF